MDKREVINLAKTYAQAVKLKFGHAKIILFGSYAKGNHNEDSDIDLAVILDDFERLDKTQLDLMRLRRPIDSRIEPHPFKKGDFNVNNPLFSEIMKYGQNIEPEKTVDL